MHARERHQHAREWRSIPPAHAESELTAQQQVAEIELLRTAGIGGLVVSALHFLGEIRGVEGDRQMLIDVIADLQIEAALLLAPDAYRIGKEPRLVVVQEVITPHIRQAYTRAAAVVGQRDVVREI